MISVDTKKKELNRQVSPSWSTFMTSGDVLGKAIPYGVYDIAANDGFVSVGVDHDTPVFAVTSIEAWWNKVGEKRYPKASALFLKIERDEFHGDWNYVIKPHQTR